MSFGSAKEFRNSRGWDSGT